MKRTKLRQMTKTSIHTWLQISQLAFNLLDKQRSAMFTCFWILGLNLLLVYQNISPVTSQNVQERAYLPCNETLNTKMRGLRMRNLDDRFYYFSEEPAVPAKNWSEAREFCNSHGLDLASLQTAAEHLQVDGNAAAIAGSRSWFWLDGTDAALEGRWVWSHSGENVTFRGWARGQPDDEGGREDCMALWSHISMPVWFDRPCQSSGKFICELNVQCVPQ